MDVEVGSSHDTAPNTYHTALKIAEAYREDEIDPVAEKRLIKKIDWQLMPLVRDTTTSELNPVEHSC
jgi:hypothetical protein